MQGADLSFDSLVIRDIEGERSFGTESLPLRVGTGSNCQLRLPGPGGEPVALLDLLDGVPIIQPVGRNTSLRLNDATLDALRRDTVRSQRVDVDASTPDLE